MGPAAPVPNSRIFVPAHAPAPDPAAGRAPAPPPRDGRGGPRPVPRPGPHDGVARARHHHERPGQVGDAVEGAEVVARRQLPGLDQLGAASWPGPASGSSPRRSRRARSWCGASEVGGDRGGDGVELLALVTCCGRRSSSPAR